MDKQRILNIIKNRRKDLKFTQKDVADKLDIERSQYSRYEIGKSEMTLDKFIEISKLLGLELSDYEEKQEIDTQKTLNQVLGMQEKITELLKKI